MRGKWAVGLLAVGTLSLWAAFQSRVPAADPPARAAAAEPPYVIVLRTREGVVTPERTRDAQTGGGFIQINQLEPNVVVALMRGAVAAGTGHHEGEAAMQFTLNQDFEIVPTRAGLRPPRLILTGWVVGALDSTLKEGGMAEQSPGCAAIRSGPETIIDLCVKQHGVSCSQNMLVNDRVGPFEAVAMPGCFCLNQTFALHAVQGKAHCHPAAAAAMFDPDPRLDSQWNEVLKPFRAVPHRDFGFRVILRVIEDVPPVVVVPPGPPADELPPPREQKRPKLPPPAQETGLGPQWLYSESPR